MCGYFRGFENKTGEIGYAIHKKARRNGYTLEAVGATISYGFKELGLNRITAFTIEENKGSIGLLKKAGFSLSKQLNEKYLVFEQFIDKTKL